MRPALLLILFSAFAAADPTSSEDVLPLPYPQGKVARVFDKIILTSHVVERMRSNVQGLRNTYTDDVAFKKGLTELFEGTALKMIQEIVLLHVADARHLTVTDADLDDFERELVLKEAGGDREKWKAEMLQQGHTMEKYRDTLRKELLCEKALDDSMDRTQLFVTPEEIRACYRDNPKQFDQPERFRYRVLGVRPHRPGDITVARRKAESLKRQLDAGADFETLVRWNNQNPQAEMGETAWRPATEIDPALAAALATAKDGDLLGPIQGESNLYIARRDAHEPARKMGFEEAQPVIERQLRREKVWRERGAAIQRVWDASAASIDLVPRLEAAVRQAMGRR